MGTSLSAKTDFIGLVTRDGPTCVTIKCNCVLGAFKSTDTLLFLVYFTRMNNNFFKWISYIYIIIQSEDTRKLILSTQMQVLKVKRIF